MSDKDQLEVVFTDGWSEDKRAAYLTDVQRRQKESTFFLRAFAPSPFHWHFHQAYEALQKDLFLPGASGLLNGIEASIRTTLCELEGRPLDGDQGTVMSNRLLREAQDKGINTSVLAFPDEDDFAEKVASNRREDAVRLVRVRNDICHGNFQGYVESHPEMGTYFTPECLAPLSARLLEISFVWTRELAKFKCGDDPGSLMAEDLTPPGNPLAQWLNGETPTSQGS